MGQQNICNTISMFKFLEESGSDEIGLHHALLYNTTFVIDEYVEFVDPK